MEKDYILFKDLVELANKAGFKKTDKVSIGCWAKINGYYKTDTKVDGKTTALYRKLED